jgi:hypothetical protein
MHERQEILDRHSDMVAVRVLEEPQWREIAMFLKPDERDIGTRNERIRVADEIFDSTGLLALDEFSGGLFNQATNPADRWFDLGLEDKGLAKWGPVRDWLWRTTALVYNSFSPSRSGFYVNAPASFADLGAFGLGTMYSAETPGSQAFTDLAIPLAETYIDTDGMGNLTSFHRVWPATGRQLKKQFGEAASHIPDNRKIYVIHAVCRNPDYREGALGPKGMEWASVYLSDDDRTFWSERGYYEMPYHAIPWTLRSGRVYPIGIGHIARPDSNMLNEMERSHIVAAQFAAEPPTLLHDQSVLTAADIQPNALLYGTINEEGKPLIQRFARGEDVRLSLEQSQQRRQSIKDAYKFSLLSILNRPQMTATEFLGWKTQQLQVLAPNLSKIHHFGLEPLLMRRCKMLARQGRLPPPPPELRGQKVTPDFVSPLAKAQKASIGQTTMQFVGAVGQIAQVQAAAGAPVTVWDKIDPDGTVDVLFDSFGPPPGVLRSDDAIAALRQQRAAAQQGQQGLENAGQVATVAATAAHAMQAATLSGGRIGGPNGSGRAN